jgi:hypothetical protein
MYPTPLISAYHCGEKLPGPVAALPPYQLSVVRPRTVTWPGVPWANGKARWRTVPPCFPWPHRGLLAEPPPYPVHNRRTVLWGAVRVEKDLPSKQEWKSVLQFSVGRTSFKMYNYTFAWRNNINGEPGDITYATIFFLFISRKFTIYSTNGSISRYVIKKLTYATILIGNKRILLTRQ